MMINSTNLLTIKSKPISYTASANAAATASVPEHKPTNSGLLNAYLNNMAMINTPAIKKLKQLHRLIITTIYDLFSAITNQKFL